MELNVQKAVRAFFAHNLVDLASPQPQQVINFTDFVITLKKYVVAVPGSHVVVYGIILIGLELMLSDLVLAAFWYKK